MDGSIETSLPGSTIKPRSTLGIKPRLAPKPFSVQLNSTIRSIHAPRTIASAQAAFKTTGDQSSKAEARAHPNITLPTTAQTPPQQTTPRDSKVSPVRLPPKDEPKTADESKESKPKEDAAGSTVAPEKLDPAPQTTGVPKAILPTTPQKPSIETTTPDSKASSVSMHKKDEFKSTNESKPREYTPDSSAAQGKIDPVPQTTGVPKVTPPTTAQKPPLQTTTPESKPSPVIEEIKDEPKTTNKSPCTAAAPVSPVAPGKPGQAPQTTPPKEGPKSNVVQKENVVQRSLKAPAAAAVSDSEEKDLKNEEDKTSVIQKPEESGSDGSSTANPEYHWRGTRRRLSTKLTSKFESGGPPPSPQTTLTVSKSSNKHNTNKPVSFALEQSQTTPEPSGKESNDGGLVDYSGGETIKRRISQLFDSSLRPEAVTKKEEQEILTRSGGVKDRIKNWVMETSSEAPKPQLEPQPRSRSSESSAAPKLADSHLPAVGTQSTQAVALSSKDHPVKQPTETTVEAPSDDAVEKPLERTADVPRESERDKSVAVAVKLRDPKPSADQAATHVVDSSLSESPRPALKRDNTKRRSVRFGIVETDDGGPPLILGSPSDSEEEEFTLGSDENVNSRPRYGRVPNVWNNNDEIKKKEEEEELKLINKLKVEQGEQGRLKLEECKEQEEEGEKESVRKREEVIRRLEEERERQRIKDEEAERQKKEEQEKERLKEEERKILQLEERLRIAQKEEQLKKDQEERERERQRIKEVKSPVERVVGKRTEGEINLEEPKEKLEKDWANKTESLKGADEDMRREKELELMMQRQEEGERERARLRNEAREKERQRRLDEEERMRAEQRQQEERRAKELEFRMQQEKERMRLMEREREEARKEEDRKKQLEKDRVEQLERNILEELERSGAKELEEKLRMEEKVDKEQKQVNQQESNLITFDSEDVPQNSRTLLSPLMKTYEPPENEMEIIYDDFSVKKPQVEVDFEDFSVKPRRWGSQAKVETHPVQGWRIERVDKELEVFLPVVVHPQENQAPEQVAELDSPEPTLAMESPEEEEEEEQEEEIPDEEQLDSADLEEEAEEEEEEESEDDVDTKEDEAEEEDTREAQVNSYCVNAEDKDTDALIDCEPDQQNGFCEPTTETDSSAKLDPDHVLEVLPQDETVDSHREPDFASFPESATPLLDTSAQRSKVDLSRRRSRSRPSRSLRLAQARSQNWRVHDSTDVMETSSKQEDSDTEERQPKVKKVSSPSPTSQRVSTVPGLNPAVLIAQLKRRSVGGGAGKEEVKPTEEKESRHEVAPSPTQLPRSPRNATHLAGAARVLPPLSGSNGGAPSSPAWLKELKSKKRLSQYESET